MAAVLNIASTLTESAARFPDQRAIIAPSERGRWREITFRELDDLTGRLASGLVAMGVTPATRIVLMVRPGIEFIALAYGLFKAGAVVVLIDPGMGARRVFRCLDQVDPQGFAAIPVVQALRALTPGRFPNARFNITVGRRWFWRGVTFDQLAGPSAVVPHKRHAGATPSHPLAPDVPTTVPSSSTDPAAIIFTSGSTGPAKGVVYEHGMFAAQVEALRDFYRIEPGGMDLPGFPLFALFNAAMGVTTVIPDMDPSRPAQVDPLRIIEPMQEHNVTQAFGSPAIWERVADLWQGWGGDPWHAGHPFSASLKRILAAGAPVPVELLRRMQAVLADIGAEMHTPYGATEALPVSSISAMEVLNRTASQTLVGAGTCVGRPVPQVRVKIVEITEGPLPALAATHELPAGKIGEIIVKGPMVTREYFRQPQATAASKIADGEGFWHRMGDVGYLDESGALWYCGRKAHIVETKSGPLYTDCVEPIFNADSRIRRCALVGVGDRPRQTPVIVLELARPARDGEALREDLLKLAAEHETTRRIDTFLVYARPLPVDVRHNIKINREELALWAAAKLRRPASRRMEKPAPPR